MLSVDEFTVGTIAQASPLSLVVGRGTYEPPTLIGWENDRVVVVQLEGPQAFSCYACDQSENDGGILIANVRIEVDEASAFNAQYEDVALGSVVRKECQLAIRAKFPTAIRPSYVTLHGDLPSAGTHQAGFKRWQIVLGEGPARRILWENVHAKQ
ncbi:hypothetical protein A7J67_04490 [Achromobacter xylosoxidans]|nr:hypothetical protein A7J67_04490 [Achromobacter xylosoxidans]